MKIGPYTARMAVGTDPITAILADLELGPERVEVLELPGPDPDQGGRLAAAASAGHVLALVPGTPDWPALARLRDACWPTAHLAAIYRCGADGRIKRHAIGDDALLGAVADGPARTVIHVRSRAEAMGRPTTRAKFDANAAGWNGNPGSPTYAHYRWMRRLLAEVARPEAGTRTLDAGCGTGWVGIEAALMGARVSAFDPSPAMVELARQNARDSGVPLDARVGFVEEVPFDDRFELVLNSGVISFAPDPQVYMDRLDRLVAPGGLLVIGDLNPVSAGFRRRRRRMPLLPVRELSGLTREQAEALLLARDYTIEARRYYQVTFPVPELTALAEKKGHGWACPAFLALNRAATGLDALLGSPFAGRFDSWILRARKAP